jgi:hypothetical protein
MRPNLAPTGSDPLAALDRVCNQRPRWPDSRVGFPWRGFSDSDGAGDPRHAISGQICERTIRRRRFGRSPVGRRTPTRAGGFRPWRRSGRHGPRLGGEHRRDGPSDAARLGASLQARIRQFAKADGDVDVFDDQIQEQVGDEQVNLDARIGALSHQLGSARREVWMALNFRPRWRLATSGTLRLLGREACGGM